MAGFESYSYYSGEETVTGCCDHGNEPSGSV